MLTLQIEDDKELILEKNLKRKSKMLVFQIVDDKKLILEK